MSELEDTTSYLFNRPDLSFPSQAITFVVVAGALLVKRQLERKPKRRRVAVWIFDLVRVIIAYAGAEIIMMVFNANPNQQDWKSVDGFVNTDEEARRIAISQTTSLAMTILEILPGLPILYVMYNLALSAAYSIHYVWSSSVSRLRFRRTASGGWGFYTVPPPAKDHINDHQSFETSLARDQMGYVSGYYGNPVNVYWFLRQTTVLLICLITYRLILFAYFNSHPNALNSVRKALFGWLEKDPGSGEYVVHAVVLPSLLYSLRFVLSDSAFKYRGGLQKPADINVLPLYRDDIDEESTLGVDTSLSAPVQDYTSSAVNLSRSMSNRGRKSTSPTIPAPIPTPAISSSVTPVTIAASKFGESEVCTYEQSVSDIVPVELQNAPGLNIQNIETLPQNLEDSTTLEQKNKQEPNVEQHIEAFVDNITVFGQNAIQSVSQMEAPAELKQAYNTVKNIEAPTELKQAIDAVKNIEAPEELKQAINKVKNIEAPVELKQAFDTIKNFDTTEFRDSISKNLDMLNKGMLFGGSAGFSRPGMSGGLNRPVMGFMGARGSALNLEDRGRGMDNVIDSMGLDGLDTEEEEDESSEDEDEEEEEDELD